MRLYPLAVFTTLAFVLGVSAATPMSSATVAAADIVEVRVVVSDANGEPLKAISWRASSTSSGSTLDTKFTTNARGVGTFDAYAGSVAELHLDWDRGYSLPEWGHVRFVGGRMVDESGTTAVHVEVTDDVAPQTIEMPELESRTLRVITADGQPVNQVPAGLLASASMPMPGREPETRIDANNIVQLLTDHRGRTTVTTWAMEPDPSVATEWQAQALSDRDGDGQLDGLLFSYAPRIGSNADQWVSYADWASGPTTTVTVPFVPIVTNAASTPGRRTGTARVSAEVRQPSPSGRTGPIGNKTASLVRHQSGGQPKVIATAKTNERGRVVFSSVRLPARTKLWVYFQGTHVVDSVVAVPSR